jgi:site-specific recombinase XerD
MGSLAYLGAADIVPLAAEEPHVYRAGSPKLLDRVRTAMRTRRMSGRTEEAYVFWIRRYILFHDKRHPATLGAAEVTRFLSSLAEQRRVSASTQNQALSALLFLYRHVLGVDLPRLEGLVHAKRPAHVPMVLSHEEVAAVLSRLSGAGWLMVARSTGDHRTKETRSRRYPGL